LHPDWAQWKCVSLSLTHPNQNELNLLTFHFVLALHFHLGIANDSSISNPKTPSGLTYEEAEFAYEPLLDEGRDRDLMELLPEYLVEEICFPRNQAVKFYTKVLDSMMKKIVVEE
jgi:hypothetical protein